MATPENQRTQYRVLRFLAEEEAWFTIGIFPGHTYRDAQEAALQAVAAGIGREEVEGAVLVSIPLSYWRPESAKIKVAIEVEWEQELVSEPQENAVDAD